ncbi:adenosylcobalamin-dependent ribonucleoside-diphosphate reductase [Thiohalomonas denitrificans]|uniref:Vitamin B12-dependent ribonucleotide reductase n=1 Tax=Thiohalomonas denitrificans TaxID=415747 RepID=A0A1G5Q161_9GAMM|nr:adenosylcobalamin-dependent ribonucleoside-diphosphate reductase [Thiohalomonas denitrificans]SCZ55533.1 ribonucleoside-diphosphate reductase class II [Thiohalomonas denitrificans]
MERDFFATDIGRTIWDSKYRQPGEASIADTWRRVARSLSASEVEPLKWEERFYGILEDFRFLPGGRILAGTGTQKQVTLFNCFVMGIIEDSMDGIFEALKEGALTMQQGGGVGYDFSTLRPRGTPAHHSGTIASGPVSFMRIWDSMCATILSTGARRGAMMATLRIDHPDIEEFIDAKRRSGELTRFNLSIQVSDAFMEAVQADLEWPLLFPAEALDEAAGDLLEREWPGYDQPVPCRVLRRVSARQLWNRIMRATFDNAEPGVLFVDRVNRTNNLWYRERITATNPCGEIPLPPYGACDLGSINLTRFVRDPFRPTAHLDLEGIGQTTGVAVRLLDNVIETSRFPLAAQAEQVRGSRRIGLGITGLADTLIMLGLRYDSEGARQLAESAMATVCHSAYRTSVGLAKEKGVFPSFERDRYLAGEFIGALPPDIRAEIARYGIRNSHLTAIAPTGTISLLADNVSSGLEPVFRYWFQRHVLERNGRRSTHAVTDYAWRIWKEQHGDAPLSPAFIQVDEVNPEAHLAMQAALQPYVDSAISKTINVPQDFPFERFKEIYRRAHDLDLKGCTTFRPNPVTGAILEASESAAPCCGIERESD